jgi:hypothetical protein
MNHIADFDRYATGGRNEGIRREVQTFRLERELRENAGARPGLRLASLVSKSPLLRRAGIAG